MMNQYKALAVKARAEALEHDKAMKREMNDGTGAQAEYYMKEAEKKRHDAKNYDIKAVGL